MRYLALCSDYDGTLAHDGVIDDATLNALERLRTSGRKLIMVTGRELDDLKKVCPRLDLFDRVVAENGALLYRPETREELTLGEPPPQRFIDLLRQSGVQPLSVGRVIVAAWEPHETVVLQAIRQLGLELQVIFNKGAVMVLPAGVNKATGLAVALQELHLSPRNAIGVGDAENDHAFLSFCECAVAVENALPMLKEAADFVTTKPRGEGVTELIEEIIADDLRARDAALTRHQVVLGKDEQGNTVALHPHRLDALLVGTSGAGKSTVAMGLMERLAAQGYSYCVIDPEGDYDNIEGAVVLGTAQQPPQLEEIVQLLERTDTNSVVNLVGLPLHDRPSFFLTLMTHIHDFRASTGRPHWLVVDEAHHLLPTEWHAAGLTLPRELEGVLRISVHPNLIAPQALTSVDTVIAVGAEPQQQINEFRSMMGMRSLGVPAMTLESGEALVWTRSDDLLRRVTVEPSRTERRRHIRKYAEGELPAERSFYFRGPEQKLNLRAPNLIAFLELADGVDDETWAYHLQRHDYSAWVTGCIKDRDLAREIAATEEQELSAADSRKRIRTLVEQRYTAPAN